MIEMKTVGEKRWSENFAKNDKMGNIEMLDVITEWQDSTGQRKHNGQ